MANSRGGVAAISTTGQRSAIAVRPPVAANAAAAPSAAAGKAMMAPSSIIAVRSWSPPAPRARARANAVDRRSAIDPAGERQHGEDDAERTGDQQREQRCGQRDPGGHIVQVRCQLLLRTDSVSPEFIPTPLALTSRICSARRGTSSNATSSICSGYQASIRAVANVSGRAIVDCGSSSTSAV